MNFSKVILFVLSVLTCVSIEAQEREDSAVYVVPTTSKADLNMYIPPKAFEPSKAFNGYLHPQTSTSVVLTLVDGANYMNIKTGMTEEYFATNNMVKTGQVDIQTKSGLSGVAYTATFTLNEKQMTRHIVFIGDLNSTLWLSTTFPSEFTNLVEKELLESYTTVTFNKR